MDKTAYNFNFMLFEEARKKLQQAENPFYVYLLGKTDLTPFYVGKGIHTRIFQHEVEARQTIRLSHKLNVIRKIHREKKQVLYAFAGFFDDEKEALLVERNLIQHIGRYDLGTGTLTNQTDGGEGTSNPSEESLMRRLATLGGESDDPERRVANDFFNSISERQASVPVKPISSWKRIEPLTVSVKNINPTERMAKAIVASVLANEIILKPNVQIPRLLIIKDVKFVIENGCGREMIKAGLLELPEKNIQPINEKMRLTELGFQYVCRVFSEKHLVELGILEL